MRAANLLAVAAAVIGAGAGCYAAGSSEPRITVEGGDAERGPAAMATYGCGSCHQIPGVAGADGRVGPPLDGFGDRVTIAGRLPNRPDDLLRWLQDPQQVDPGVDMPDLGVTEQDARDIAAYLLGLR